MKQKLFNRSNRIFTPRSGTTIYINYSAVGRILEIAFNGRAIYHYFKVQSALWEEYKAIIK